MKDTNFVKWGELTKKVKIFYISLFLILICLLVTLAVLIIRL